MTDGATTAEAERVLDGATDDAIVAEIERRLSERMLEGRLDVADCNVLASRIHKAIEMVFGYRVPRGVSKV